MDGALKLNLSFSFDLKTGGLTCIVFSTSDQSENELLKQFFTRQDGPPKSTQKLVDLGMETLAWQHND